MDKELLAKCPYCGEELEYLERDGFELDDTEMTNGWLQWLCKCPHCDTHFRVGESWVQTGIVAIEEEN